ncbi:aluminum-activated malate transporter 2-like [Andrographis paniculata]|uniref:aluminum-activated malate transporter 2-like n=1 Tax=Andrographis paniculata TaxID=175694 RepID=UPI0021E8A5EC|nr:aluminum-activated malate transporter 2-like [Andrographis paniculata]
MASSQEEKGCFGNLIGRIIGTAKDAQKLGKEDPRRIVHSLKVGLAISLVSLFYYFDFSYEGFGVSAMWAVMTVVVVFEFSVGATLGKGINRAIATLLGGALGVALHRLASFAGEKIECVILGISVFLIASVATYVRFFPKVKARFDYGLLIFILTFSLISVSGYRDDEVIDMAYKRLSTILIGGAATVFICVFVCPVWAGEDFHKLTAANVDKLGIFLEGFEREYFHGSKKGSQDKTASLSQYKSVLNSKGIEDSLVNFAKWEPRHGKFRYRQPWNQYLKVGSLTRECAYKIDALNARLNSSVQAPMEARARIQELCSKMCSECSLALRELATAINTMTRPSTVDSHVVNAKTAAQKLKSCLKTKSSLWPDMDLLDVIPLLTDASLLIDIVSCTVKITDSVHELSSKSKFKAPPENKMAKQTSRERAARSTSIGSHSFTITVE